MLVTMPLVVIGILAADPSPLEQGRQLAQAGKYGEALEAFDKAEKDVKPDDSRGRDRLALGRAECLAATGKTAEALAVLEKIAFGDKPTAAVPARIAELEFGRGRLEGGRRRRRACLEDRARRPFRPLDGRPVASGGERSPSTTCAGSSIDTMSIASFTRKMLMH